ncbi:MFS transporter [Bartonella sp. CE47NXGY]|uniref:MFS transporter n=1 Tax=Bartonella sp. CE47NXGY TaxID=3243514 RepID=UPI0035CF3345
MLVATIAQASACFFVQGIGPLAKFFKKDFSLSNSQIGLLSSAAQFLPIIGLLVAGELLDKFNERYIIGVGAIGVSVALLLGAIADNYISLLVCLLIIGGFIVLLNSVVLNLFLHGFHNRSADLQWE